MPDFRESKSTAARTVWAVAVCAALASWGCHGALRGRSVSLAAGRQFPAPVSRPAPPPDNAGKQRNPEGAGSAAVARDSHVVVLGGALPEEPNAPEQAKGQNAGGEQALNEQRIAARGSGVRIRRGAARDGRIRATGASRARAGGGMLAAPGTPLLPIAGFLLAASLVLLWALFRRRRRPVRGEVKVHLKPRLVLDGERKLPEAAGTGAKPPTKFQIFLNPDKYGYVPCPNCNSYGSDVLDKHKVCALCGGWGVVPKNHRRVTEITFRPGRVHSSR